MGPGSDPGLRVEVLRLGHRPGRDPRLTTHVLLTARAFGVEVVHLEPPDDALARRVVDLARRFGGSFRVRGERSGRKLIQDWPGSTLHLTMYGEDLDELRTRWTLEGPVLVVVGGPKVSREVYERATYNVAVTHQPHSEVAALAILLDRLLGTPQVERRDGARIQVLPARRGKRVRDLTSSSRRLPDPHEEAEAPP